MEVFHALQRIRTDEPVLFEELSGPALTKLRDIDFDFHLLADPHELKRLPSSAAEFQRLLAPGLQEDPELVEFPLRIFSDFISSFREKFRAERETPEHWALEQFSMLEQRVRFELLQGTGLLQTYRERGLSPSHLCYFLKAFPLERAHYFHSRVLRKEDSAELVSRFGLHILLSCDWYPEAAKEKLGPRCKSLQDFLRSVPATLRLQPGKFALRYPKAHQEALCLCKRLSWAVNDFAPVEVDFQAVEKGAYKRLVYEGREVAESYLASWGLRKRQRKAVAARLQRQFENQTGRNLRIAQSCFEDEVARFFDAEGIAYRRHVRYSELVDTPRRFRMDFLVYDKNQGPVCIEVTDFQDTFLHNEGYRDVFELKRQLAETRRIPFITLEPGQRYKSLFSGMGLSRVFPEAFFVETEPPVTLVKRKQERSLRRCHPPPPANRAVFAFVENVYQAAHLSRR